MPVVNNRNNNKFRRRIIVRSAAVRANRPTRTTQSILHRIAFPRCQQQEANDRTHQEEVEERPLYYCRVAQSKTTTTSKIHTQQQQQQQQQGKERERAG
jgi:hypothetical protein